MKPTILTLLLPLILSGPVGLQAADYAVSISAGVMTVTDTSGLSDTLSVTQPAAFQIQFSSAGRTFSVNEGPELLGSSGPLASGGVSRLTVDTAAGNDTIEIGAFATLLRSVTLNGGAGDDTVHFLGNLSVGSDGLNVDLTNDTTDPGADRVILADGAQVRGVVATNVITIRCSRSIFLGRGARLETVDSNLTVEANQQPLPTPGDFVGVTLRGGILRTIGSGNLFVRGRGGDSASGGQSGIVVDAGGQISGWDVDLNAAGGGAAGSGRNTGLVMDGVGSSVSAVILRVDTIPGAGQPVGPNGSWGLALSQQALIQGTIFSLATGSMDIDPSALVASDQLLSVNLATPSGIARYGLDLGGADALGAFPVLGLSAQEMGRFSTPILSVPGGKDTVISAPVIASQAAKLFVGRYNSAVRPIVAGVDVTMPNGGQVGFSGRLVIDITGLTPDTEATQLNIVGEVLLSGGITLSSTYAGTAGDTFVVVANDGVDPMVGTFDGLPEGAYLPWSGSPTLVGQVSYTGGTGNDAVVTLVPLDPSLLVVRETAADGAGSLRRALSYAAAHAGPDTVVFHPSLSRESFDGAGVIIPEGSELSLDASALDDSVFIRGNMILAGKTTLRRVRFSSPFGPILDVAATGEVTIEDCHFSGVPGNGGIYNYGQLNLTRCVLADLRNSDNGGGAIWNAGTLNLRWCTIADCSAQEGGAIANDGTATLEHCTISGNRGGGISNRGNVTLNACIVAGNTPTGPGSDFAGNPPAGGSNVIGGDALLSPLGDYGGRTFTMALLPGSPARNAAIGSTATQDQRGFPIVGIPDIGAYEAGTIATCQGYLWESLPPTATTADYESTSDYDGDGVQNDHEWMARTDPAAASSVLRLTIGPGNQGQLSLTFPSVSGRRYTLWTSESLEGDWTEAAQPAVMGNGSTLAFRVPAPALGIQRRFYRVQVGP